MIPENENPMKQTVRESRIDLHISGLRSGEGRVAISIFRASDAKFFPETGARAVETLLVDLNGRRELTVSTKNLPPDTYAVALFHDENSDGKLQTNFLGIPKEGFGFSNNPKVMFGPPAFDRASFGLGRDVKEVSIRLKYFL